jgi:hypothetical protein
LLITAVTIVASSECALIWSVVQRMWYITYVVLPMQVHPGHAARPWEAGSTRPGWYCLPVVCTSLRQQEHGRPLLLQGPHAVTQDHMVGTQRSHGRDMGHTVPAWGSSWVLHGVGIAKVSVSAPKQLRALHSAIGRFCM